MLYENSHSSLIRLGDIKIEKQNSPNSSYCWIKDDDFDYNNEFLIPNVKNYRNDKRILFELKRFIVIQMKDFSEEEKNKQRNKYYEIMKKNE